MYVIVTEPGDCPVTFPLILFTVAIELLLLDHDPPEVASFKSIVAPSHTSLGPVIGAKVGGGFTVTVAVVTPGHPGAIISKLTTWEVPVKFVSVPEMDVTCPGEASSIPPTFVELSLVQVAPTPPKLIVVNVPPEHIV